MRRTGRLSTGSLEESYWKCSNRYAVLLSQWRRSLSRTSFRRLLVVHRLAAERVVREGIGPLGEIWVGQAEALLARAEAELQSGVADRESLRRLDHAFGHLGAGIGG